MNMDQSAIFLAGSILTMLGFIVVVIGIIVINNLFSKFWKPVKFIRFEPVQTAFMTQEQYDEMIAQESKQTPKREAKK